ncbi:MAG: carboxypeptidase-like regulatory domain-containing protein [Candidatus Methanoculleus thermohydrogenotrophicum]
MRRRHRHVLLATLLIAVAILTVISSIGYGSLPGGLPIGFSGQQDAAMRPGDLRDLQREQPDPSRGSEELLPLMESVLESTAGVLSATAKGDYDHAGEELDDARSDAGRLNTKIIGESLMNSEIHEFALASQDTHQSLSGYLGDCRRLDGSTSLEERGVRKRLAMKKEIIVERGNRIIDIAQQFGINTTSFEESLEAFASHPDLVAPSASGNDTGPAPITLTVEPKEGAFGDTLIFSGELPAGTKADSVTLTIDGESAAPAPADDTRYTYSYTISAGNPGVHSAYATAAGMSSDEVEFTIRPADTYLTCDVSYDDPETHGSATCSGMLITITGAPVAGAPVVLSIDGKHTVTLRTGANGSYTHTGTFTEGRHTVTAHFTGEDLPLLNATESRPTEFFIPSLGSVLAPRFLITSSVAIIAVSAVWFLRRSPSRAEYQGVRLFPEVDELLGLPQQEDETSAPPSSRPEPFEAPGHELTPREEVNRIYLNLRDRVAMVYGLTGAAAMTPREFSARLSRAPISSDLEAFISRAEVFQYGGEVPGEDDLAGLAALATAIIRQAGGEGD